MNNYQCTVCGRFFDIHDKSAFIHPNLFGGVDKLCGVCVKHEEEARNKRLGNTRKLESRKKIDKE